MKKKYIKPAVSVYPLPKHPVLLVGSGEGTDGYDDNFGYMPRINEDHNSLA